VLPEARGGIANLAANIGVRLLNAAIESAVVNLTHGNAYKKNLRYLYSQQVAGGKAGGMSSMAH
jgi:hypothetical protein